MALHMLMLRQLVGVFVLAQTKAAGPVYTQSITTPSGIVQMQTSAQQLVRDGKPDIWLVGAVHVGSKDYYSSLQKLLDAQELVLFEGVTKAGQKDPWKVDQSKAVGGQKPVYKVLSDALGLEFQLNSIRYDKPNWKNCDLTWEELDKVSQGPAGGGKSKGMYGEIKQILDPNSPQAKAFATMMDTATPGTKEALKLIIVKSVASGDLAMDAETERVVIQARNKVVLDSLGKLIGMDKSPKSIAVFYGAKHLADMETTLVSKYGYHLGKQQWLLAADADPSKVDATGKMMLDMLEKQKKGAGKF